MNENMPEANEAELKVMTCNMYKFGGGTVNVLNCLISMIESQLVVLKKLREILLEEEK